MPELGELPRSLFTSKTVVLLKIHGRFMFNVPDNVRLPNLKILHLHSLIYLDDASPQRLFSGCPALEDLEIIRHGWDYAWTFDVSVPSLKRFTLKISRNKMKRFAECECKIMVNAPNIEYLEISDFGSDRILIGGLPCLVEAHVSIFMLFGYWKKREKEYGNDAYGLLRSLSNVKRLSLTASTLKSLRYADHAHLPTFCNLVHLELGLDKENGLLPLPYLLESSPKLEVLVFREGITLPGGLTYNCRVRDYKYHWIPPQEIPNCLICCLKAIVVHQFCGVEEEMNLLKYLLKNAMVSEKMIIFCHRGYSVNFGEELSNYAKCTSNCKFILHIPKCQGKRKRKLRIVPGS
ncbi:putative FBD-associated F-box protein At3g50710 [Rhododendron vialii]|uniref:putative FBD-associated F-box protein At3g50710 n=1 Tax=Rhododendron vialii TaxID=182163 RepID=UPI00265F79DF|nr:putative FBD-associated F-box protein At3g50710 [Rhododendron vialii]